LPRVSGCLRCLGATLLTASPLRRVLVAGLLGILGRHWHAPLVRAPGRRKVLNQTVTYSLCPFGRAPNSRAAAGPQVGFPCADSSLLFPCPFLHDTRYSTIPSLKRYILEAVYVPTVVAILGILARIIHGRRTSALSDLVHRSEGMCNTPRLASLLSLSFHQLHHGLTPAYASVKG
jgi:hypothetical protein